MTIPSFYHSIPIHVRAFPSIILSYIPHSLAGDLQKVSSNGENTSKSSRDTSLGGSTGVRDRSVGRSSVLANSGAVGVSVTTSAGGNNRAQSARDGSRGRENVGVGDGVVLAAVAGSAKRFANSCISELAGLA
jgi:hypothetical protein